jgi:SNF2 family DNA or RNA helicase
MPRIKKCWSCGVADFRRIQIVKGFKNLHVLNKIVATVAIRKTAEECLDLPPLNTIDVPFAVATSTRKIYNEMVEGTVNELLAGGNAESPKAAQRVLRLLQILAGFMPDAEGTIHRFDNSLRLQTITDLLEAIFASADSKVIIWGHFIESMNIVAELLDKLKVSYVRVDGSVKHREALREKFETDPECKVYLGQVQTGIGINLVAANYVIYADLPFFSWSHYKQSVKRAHRIGQTRPVTVYRLYAEGSLHEYVLHVLDLKDSVVQSLVNQNLCSMCSDARKCIDADVKPFDAACSLAKSQVKNRKARLAQL